MRLTNGGEKFCAFFTQIAPEQGSAQPKIGGNLRFGIL